MTAPAEATQAVRSGRWGAVLDMVGPVTLAAAASIAVGLVVEHRMEARLAEMAPAGPAVVVVDDIGLVRLAIENGADRYNPQAIASEIERLVAEAGLGDSVLISQSMVLYSPEEARIEVAEPKPEPQLRPVLGAPAQ